jgi:hypothetical protein
MPDERSEKAKRRAAREQGDEVDWWAAGEPRRRR